MAQLLHSVCSQPDGTPEGPQFSSPGLGTTAAFSPGLLFPPDHFILQSSLTQLLPSLPDGETETQICKATCCKSEASVLSPKLPTTLVPCPAWRCHFRSPAPLLPSPFLSHTHQPNSFLFLFILSPLKTPVHPGKCWCSKSGVRSVQFSQSSLTLDTQPSCLGSARCTISHTHTCTQTRAQTHPHALT